MPPAGDGSLNDLRREIKRRLGDASPFKCSLTPSGEGLIAEVTVWLWELPAAIERDGAHSYPWMVDKYDLWATDAPNEFDIEDQNEIVYEDLYDKASAILDRNGWDFLGKGIGRQVWQPTPASIEGRRVDDCVIKLAFWSSFGGDAGWQQNVTAIINWELAGAELREFMVEVFDWGDRFLWITVEKADLDHPMLTDDVKDRLLRQIQQAGGAIETLVDTEVGVVEGKPVIVDTGNERLVGDPQRRLQFRRRLKREFESSQRLDAVKSELLSLDRLPTENEVRQFALKE